MNNLSGIINSLRTMASKHSPEILTGIGIAGMMTTTIMAVRATPKALTIINNERRKKELECGDFMLSKKDIVLLTWKCYIPSVVTGILSTACLIGASKQNIRRNAALATAYSISENALKTYQHKVIETIGEKKETAVRDAVAKDELAKNPVSREIIIVERGNTLCYDTISGRYFKSDIDKLKKVETELNRRLVIDMNMFVSLNDFYYEIGLNTSSIGDDIGWNIDRELRLEFSSQLADNGEPCLVLNYAVAPQYNY